MTRGALLTLTCAIALGLGLSGCSGDDEAGPSATPATASASSTQEAAEAEVFAAYTAFLAEKKAIQNSGKVPADAYANTLAPSRIEKERAVARDYAERGIVRVGQSEVKDPEVVDLTDESATLLVCENEDGWGFKPKGGEPQFAKGGWRPRGMKVVQVDGRWLVAETLEQDRLTKECSA